jgi:hypothetical protein
MGQATVDLPDPSEASATPAPAASADDLLSQLAGDEIDRLLAEAEVEKGPAAPAESSGDASPAPLSEASAELTNPTPEISPPSKNELDALHKELALTEAVFSAPAPAAKEIAPSSSADAELDALHKELAIAEPVAPPVAPATKEFAPAAEKETDPAVEAATNALLDDLFKELSDQPAVAPQAETPAPAPAATATTIADPSAAARELDEAIARGSADALPEVKGESETSQAEKDALTQVVEAIDSKSDNLPDLESPTAVPFYLKPLVWLNAPMMLLPDELRDAMGKIAIMTMVNAVAVYTYVMLFRKHH